MGSTFTSLLVRRDPVAGLTSGTAVGAFGVGAHAAEAEVLLSTLVHVWKQRKASNTATQVKTWDWVRVERTFASQAVSRRFKSKLAVLTNVGTRGVDAHASEARVAERTLVDV